MHSLSNDTIDRIINGDEFSEVLRLYSTQRTFNNINWGTDVRINGFEGNDLIIASHGDDELFGGSGNDTFESFYGLNEIFGGTGFDVLDYSWFGDFTTQSISLGVNVNMVRGVTVARNSGVDFGDEFYSIEDIVGSDLADRIVGNSVSNEISGGFGSDYIDGGLGGDVLEGDGGNDTIYGRLGDDDIFGGSGSDNLLGGFGRDDIFGGSGDDDIQGGLGRDRLLGGSGEDVFIYTSIDDSNEFDGVDLIRDFTLDVDLIDLSRIDAHVNRAGKQNFTWIGTQQLEVGFTGELRYGYDRIADITFIEGDVNGDGEADITIDLEGRYFLQRSDFDLIL
jgi:serralysin